MRMHEPPSWFLPVSLLTSFFLLAAVPALADPHGSMQGHSKSMSSSSSPHGKSGSYGRGGHPSTSSYEGHGKHHAKRSGHGGLRSTHPGKHQSAGEFIGHILKFKEGMSLTAEQEQKLHALKTDYKRTRIKMKAEVDLANIDLHEIVKNEKASLSDIEAELTKLQALKTKLYMASIKAKRDAKAVLSEEQRARMDKIHERIKSHGSNMGHPGDYSKYKKSKKSMGHGTTGHMK